MIVKLLLKGETRMQISLRLNQDSACQEIDIAIAFCPGIS
jgi:hypothetical protein